MLGRGSSLIGGTISTRLTRDETQRLIVDGFFPECGSTDRPQRQAASGFQDIGLPYEADPAITKQVAAFLADHAGELSRATTVRRRIETDQNDRSDAPAVQRRCVSQRNASAPHA